MQRLMQQGQRLLTFRRQKIVSGMISWIVLLALPSFALRRAQYLDAPSPDLYNLSVALEDGSLDPEAKLDEERCKGSRSAGGCSMGGGDGKAEGKGHDPDQRLFRERRAARLAKEEADRCCERSGQRAQA